MKSNFKMILPVVAGFFVMGFCDLAGIAASYLKQDFGLSETVAGFVPSMVFIWFFLFSVPAAMIMNRIGRKVMVQVSNCFTFAGLLLPFIHYDFVFCMAGLILLGIGNTLLQVSLNPLLSNVVSGRGLASALTAGQVVKAVSSFCGPFAAAFALNTLGEWRYVFPVLAAVTLSSMIWLMLTELPSDPPVRSQSSAAGFFSLLGDRTVLLLFLGIFFVVGLDVGLNTAVPKLLMERAGFSVDKAGFGSSVYFACRTSGSFLGAFFLARTDAVRWFRGNIVFGVLALALLLWAGNAAMIFILSGLAGFFCSSIFSIIYSLALKSRPDKENEISGLMIMGVSGGAVIPPLMGIACDATGSQSGSVAVILICSAYLLFCAFRSPVPVNHETQENNR